MVFICWLAGFLRQFSWIRNWRPSGQKWRYQRCDMLAVPKDLFVIIGHGGNIVAEQVISEILFIMDANS
jgi:hypothetical protein